jgi:hypothetical protein
MKQKDILGEPEKLMDTKKFHYVSIFPQVETKIWTATGRCRCGAEFKRGSDGRLVCENDGIIWDPSLEKKCSE